jgi:hypothetical protein
MAINSFSNGNFINSLQAAGKNAVIGGGFDIWQRGTSVAVAASTPSYTADRWYYSNGANQASVISRQVTGDTTNLPNIQYCARVQRNSGQTGTGNTYFAQSFESVNSIPFTGQAVTLSFYARKGANYSATSNILTVYFNYGTGTDQNVISGYTGGANVTVQNATLTATWQRFTYTGTVPTTATELGLFFQTAPTGTAGVNDYYEVTGVQVELGSVATTFSRAGGTIQGELAACQRYYQFVGGGSAVFPIVGGYASAASQNYRWPLSFPVQMRVSPTITKNGTWGTGSNGQPSAVFINNQGFSIEISSTGTGNTYAFPNDPTHNMTISAEL